MTSQPLLRIDGLTAHIGGQTVLQDISLDIEQGEWMAIVGESGAGKSTLLRLMMGLRKPVIPTSGTMLFEGKTSSFTQMPPYRPQGIAHVPQSPAHGFDPLRRLRWQWDQLVRVKFGADKAHDPRSEILEAFGLPQFHGQFPHQWSRGMQQRLLLAMALVGKPKLLILDEPTSALDPLIAAQVLREIQRIAQDRGITVALVTHDLALAEKYADSIAILQSGRMVEQGKAQKVLNMPVTDYARALVSSRHWHANPQGAA